VNHNLKNAFDVIIVGGGLVGASLAIGLSGRGLKIALIEAHSFRRSDQPSYDDRTLALSRASCGIFEKIGLWSELSQAVTPIHNVHVSNRGFWGFTRIKSAELGVENLGHVAEARVIGQAVLNRLSVSDDIEVICPATAIAVEQNQQRAMITIHSEGVSQTLQASLVLAADGADSKLRELLSIPAQQHDYEQNVTPGNLHQNCAYERFTDSGPLAILPHTGQRCGMVWITRNPNLQGLLDLDDNQFLAQLQQRFGYRLGHFKRLGRRSSYPLKLSWVSRQYSGRVLLIGNAAHAIHPVAAQGFNLGLRDVAVLIELINQAQSLQLDLGSETLMQSYLKARLPDQQNIVRFTDGLARMFSHESSFVATGRNLAMLALDLIPGLKAGLAKTAMGYAVEKPVLDLPETDVSV